VDGTVFDHSRNKIPAKHIEAIEQLKSQGIKVCLCTGRCIDLVKNLGIDMGLWDGFVLGNGSYVYDENGKLLHEHPMAKETADAIFQLAKQKNIPIFAGGSSVFVTEMNGPMQDLLKKLNITNVPVRNRKEEDTFCILSLGNGSTDREPDFEALQDVNVLYNPLGIDLMQAGLSKYDGIRFLMDYWNLNDYMAFGDAPNDVEMLAHAKVGVAMADGSQEAKEAADDVCPSAKEAGIALWLDKEGYVKL
jgi:hypothetical protein